MESMKILKARVTKGRLVLDEPTDLPEGTEKDLVFADEIDEMDPDDEAALLDCIEESLEQSKRGEGRPASEILDRIRKT